MTEVLGYLALAVVMGLIAVALWETVLRRINGWPSLFRDVREAEKDFRAARAKHRARLEQMDEIIRKSKNRRQTP